jgi:hypothetical protein
LRQADIAITSQHDLDKKKRISIVLGHLLLGSTRWRRNFSSMGLLVGLPFHMNFRPEGMYGPDDLAKGGQRLNFELSKHALEELERRQIPRTTIERVLESPEQKLRVLEKITCYQSRVNFAGKQYLLRVMVNDAAEPSVVVTVYRTSKIRKYWKEP